MKELLVDEFDSPIGTMVSVVLDDKLIHLDFADCQERRLQLLTHRYNEFKQISTKNPLNIRDFLTAYFDKDRQSFDKIKRFTGGTKFQRTVWERLQKIPYGTTLSYAQLAKAIGKPKAVRAVANANARNPIAIIIPCHRVIAKSGALAGYAGGTYRKAWLLRHESRSTYHD